MGCSLRAAHPRAKACRKIQVYLCSVLFHVHASVRGTWTSRASALVRPSVLVAPGAFLCAWGWVMWDNCICLSVESNKSIEDSYKKHNMDPVRSSLVHWITKSVRSSPSY